MIKKYIYSFAASVLLLLAGCTPQTYELGAVDVSTDDLVEGIAYTITHDASNPNIVYLESKMDSKYRPLWEHPQGRSQSPKVTLQIPFEGTYTVRFGVETRGGVVYGAPTTFTIDSFFAGFVNDELWTNLTGGVGESKVWVFDNGAYGLSTGELSYADPSSVVEFNNFTINYQEGAGSTGDANMWNSTMTFSLIGGATVSIHDASASTDINGTFMLNTTDHTLNFTDAELMHTSGQSGRSSNWAKDLKILTLTKDQLQVGIMRDNDEGPWWMIWNFVSKEYADNYVPSVNEVTGPTLPEGWKDAVTEIVSTNIVWKLSANSPFDWFNLDGTRKNNFSVSAGTYPEWCTPAAGVDGIILTMNSARNTYKLELPDFTTVEGTYSLSNDGVYTFDQGLLSYLIGSDWIYFGADEANSLQLLAYETSSVGPVSGMWLGVKQTDVNGRAYQYLGYHFEPQLGEQEKPVYGGSLHAYDEAWVFIDSEEVSIQDEGQYTFTLNGAYPLPYGMYLDVLLIWKDHPNATLTINSIKADGTALTIDPTLLSTTAGDAPTTARLYILNPWGGDNQIVSPSDIAFASSLEVTITVAFND
ncbi:MAG: hypothetical protein LBM62_07390 [Mediterranea sp.]|jgi:hypothetical protein|nr:hypothetical protein [Mediterranea sp.]